MLHSYIHLRYVDISENHLTDLSPLNYLTHLLWLKADGNQLRSARLNELPYLQIASFAYNQITDTEGISHPRLASLDLKGGASGMGVTRFLPILGPTEWAVWSLAVLHSNCIHSFTYIQTFVMIHDGSSMCWRYHSEQNKFLFLSLSPSLPPFLETKPTQDELRKWPALAPPTLEPAHPIGLRRVEAAQLPGAHCPVHSLAT